MIRKIIFMMIMINLISMINVAIAATVLFTPQQNTEISYKGAMSEISKASNERIERTIIKDKLSTKKYNFFFKENMQLNYIKMETIKQHEENKELKITWLGILKVDYGNKLIVDSYGTALSDEKMTDNYNFKIGNQAYDKNGDSTNGYYNNIYYSCIVEINNKDNYKDYNISHFLRYSLD